MTAKPMIPFGPEVWDRMVRAVEIVKRRLLRSAKILRDANIPYAVIGGHALAVWVERADQGGVRNTPDVNILIRRCDLEEAIKHFETAGFILHDIPPIVLLDGPEAGLRDSVHLVVANEKIRPDDFEAAPDLDSTETTIDGDVTYIGLSELVRMKLVSYRVKDRMHLRDMADVGLVDASWLAKLPPELADRLQRILDTPDG